MEKSQVEKPTRAKVQMQGIGAEQSVVVMNFRNGNGAKGLCYLVLNTGQPKREEPMNKTKPFEISKKVVIQAYEQVKANKGTAGIDEQSIGKFEENLKNNLYKLWNRMSSGCYFPSPVKAVEIPKKSGGKRMLGIPTVTDRIAQMVVKLYFEPEVELYFCQDSYGYRPEKSALDAIAITRQRCWKYDWVLEFDIKGLFDAIDHELLMRAVIKHTDSQWIILYITRWLNCPFQTSTGEIIERMAGTPQGGVISPVLANLFLHYAFDKWMERNNPQNPWVRYADDGVIHCKTKEEAEDLLIKLKERFEECKLELHPDKTRIIYCKDKKRTDNHQDIQFDFLGYTFRPRNSQGKDGEQFLNFLPAVSNKAIKAMGQTIRGWRIHRRTDKKLVDLAHVVNPIVRGWINYYSRFYKSAMYQILHRLNWRLSRWVAKKYKRVHKSRRGAWNLLVKMAERNPKLFVHWQFGSIPTVR